MERRHQVDPAAAANQLHRYLRRHGDAYLRGALPGGTQAGETGLRDVNPGHFIGEIGSVLHSGKWQYAGDDRDGQRAKALCVPVEEDPQRRSR